MSPTTRATPVFHGVTYHVAHRCIQGLRLLLPDKEVNAILAFALAHALAKTDVLLHGNCFHVNHEHLVITDPHAQLPRFMQILHSLIARALNARFKRRGPLWDPSLPYIATPITSREQLLNYLAYTATNPVKDGFVSTPSRWPGFLTLPSQAGTTLTIHRPKTAFFGGNSTPSSRSSLPTKLPLTLSLPLNFYEPDELHRYKTEYQAAVDQALATHQTNHSSFLGPRATRALNRFGAPTKPLTSTRRASRTKNLLSQAELEQWREAYVVAREAWGDTSKPNLRFPYGAWLLPTLYNAPVVERAA